MREIQTITSASRSQSDQIHDRIVRYLWTMGLRVGFFLLAVIVHNWWSILFLALSVLLPWIAVVNANSGAERRVVPGTYINNPSLQPGPTVEDEQNGQSHL